MSFPKFGKNNKPSVPQNKYQKISYSQSGEDLIIRFIFDAIGVTQPTYVDIGAHHPQYINNTAIFYQSGSTGINIEPDPELFKQFKKDRKKDINLNIGVGEGQKTLDFYIMSTPTLNTFSKKEVKTYEKEGYSIVSTIQVKTKTINSIIREHLGVAPDLINLDAEGIDLEILMSLDLKKYGPKIFCVETISFSQTGNGIKNNKIINYLSKNGYLLYADTQINSIFVKEKLWKH